MTTDLTSAVFLGPAPEVDLVGELTSGKPAVLDEPLLSRRAARDLAAVHGAPAGLLARSSFHGLLDAIESSSLGETTVLVDEHVYPVARWAAAAATAGRGKRRTAVLSYRHLDAADARRRARQAGSPVVVVSDGLCGSCLRPAPLAALSAVARANRGRLVVDDTLAAGVLGPGGAGTASFMGAPAPDAVTVASLAKGYGVPLALVAGPEAVIDLVRCRGSARIHASGPSPADVAALVGLPDAPELARRRRRVGELSGRCRAGCRRLGLTPLGVRFPLVHLVGPTHPVVLRRALAARDIRVLVTLGRCTRRPALTFCLRSDLDDGDLDRLLHALAGVVRWRSS